MSRGATARLFVAADPPAQVCEELSEWARGLAASRGAGGVSLRLVQAHALHLTLCFLGSRPVGEIQALARVLGSCAEYVAGLSVGAPVWLPPRRPRALAVEIHDPMGDLARLQQQLADALSQASGWEPEQRRFRPHITLARMRADARGRAGLQPLPATPRLSCQPESITLYRSWLTPSGASYEAIATCQLPPTGS